MVCPPPFAPSAGFLHTAQQQLLRPLHVAQAAQPLPPRTESVVAAHACHSPSKAQTTHTPSHCAHAQVADVKRLPFLRIKLHDACLDLATLAESAATYINITTEQAACDDLRLAYCKVMTEYDVSGQDEGQEDPQWGPYSPQVLTCSPTSRADSRHLTIWKTCAVHGARAPTTCMHGLHLVRAPGMPGHLHARHPDSRSGAYQGLFLELRLILLGAVLSLSRACQAPAPNTDICVPKHGRASRMPGRIHHHSQPCAYSVLAGDAQHTLACCEAPRSLRLRMQEPPAPSPTVFRDLARQSSLMPPTAMPMVLPRPGAAPLPVASASLFDEHKALSWASRERSRTAAAESMPFTPPAARPHQPRLQVGVTLLPCLPSACSDTAGAGPGLNVLKGRSHSCVSAARFMGSIDVRLVIMTEHEDGRC